MEKTVKADNRIAMIPIFRISADPSVIGQSYSRKELISLSRSIEKNGIIQPITVRDISPCEFELVSGERRLRAAVMAGLTEIPCIILHCTRKQSAVYRLVENLQRESAVCLKLSEALKALMERYGFSEEQAALQLGISEKMIRQYLSFLEFTPRERQILEMESLTFSQMAQIIRIKDKSLRRKVIARVVKGELSDTQTQALVNSVMHEELPVHKLVVKDIRLFCNTIERAVATMRQSGIKASLERRESDGQVEFYIAIPIHK